MQTKANLQDLFLLRARRDKLPVTMFLMNGFQMRGTIAGFDAFVVVLETRDLHHRAGAAGGSGG